MILTQTATMISLGCLSIWQQVLAYWALLSMKSQSPWMEPEEVKQANYVLLSLLKGLKFLQAVPPSESPMGHGTDGYP